MQPRSLPLERIRGRWTVAIGRARVDVADGAAPRSEAAEVARRLVASGLVRGVHLVSTKPAADALHRGAKPEAPCLCGDCLRCELAQLRAKRGRRGAL